MKQPKKGVLDTLAAIAQEVDAPPVRVEPAAPHPLPATLPATVATRSYVNGPWDPFIEGQVPGPNGVIAIKFADGSIWDIGYGWRK